MKKLILFAFLVISFFTVQAQELISSAYLGSQSKAQLESTFSFVGFQNGIDYYKINYSTLDVHGAVDTASGLLVLPNDLSKAYPQLCYQHGTVAAKDQIPSNLEADWLLAAFWGGCGYITTAADYLGLGDSKGFHPYVHAESEASAAIDLLRAARTYADQNDIAVVDQLFITGYSQGGHGAMAAHREIESNLSDEFNVVASAPMSGPYSISEVMKDLIFSEEIYYYPAYIPNTILSYETVYGDLYEEISDVFKAPYANLIEQFYNGIIDLGDLNNMLIAELESETGSSVPKKIVHDDVLLEVETDPNHPLNIALVDNDTYDWSPNAPTRLYYCEGDDQVPFENSIVAEAGMNDNGAFDVKAQKMDTNANQNHVECVTPAVIACYFFFIQYQTIEEITGISEPQISMNFFPNPAKDKLFIKDLPTKGNLQILELNGKKAFQNTVNQGDNEISLPQLGTGIYFIQLEINGQIIKDKLIINN